MYLSIYRYLSARLDDSRGQKSNSLLTFECTRSGEISVNNDMNRPDSHFHPSSSMSLLPRGPLTQNGSPAVPCSRRTTTRHPRNRMTVWKQVCPSSVWLASYPIPSLRTSSRLWWLSDVEERYAEEPPSLTTVSPSKSKTLCVWISWLIKSGLYICRRWHILSF